MINRWLMAKSREQIEKDHPIGTRIDCISVSCTGSSYYKGTVRGFACPIYDISNFYLVVETDEDTYYPYALASPVKNKDKIYKDGVYHLECPFTEDEFKNLV